MKESILKTAASDSSANAVSLLRHFHMNDLRKCWGIALGIKGMKESIPKKRQKIHAQML
jgi:hypothetical protein